jgi:hypothetical protein
MSQGIREQGCLLAPLIIEWAVDPPRQSITYIIGFSMSDQ